MRIDTGALWAHLTNHIDLRRNRKLKNVKGCLGIYMSASIVRGEVIHFCIQGSNSTIVHTAVISELEKLNCPLRRPDCDDMILT